MDQEFWRGKTVLVAGATGFLGGWIVRQLIESKANVAWYLAYFEKDRRSEV